MKNRYIRDLGLRAAQKHLIVTETLPFPERKATALELVDEGRILR